MGIEFYLAEDTINDRAYYKTRDSSADYALWFDTDRRWCLGDSEDL